MRDIQRSAGGTKVFAEKLRSGFLVRLKEMLGLALQTGREIFDEAAYSRFLARSGMPSSPASYAAFQGELAAARARRPRCC